MAHLGTLRDFRFSNNADDIRGSKLYGRNDEKLGEISDVIFDHQSGDLRYVVVDTGGWLSSKQFLVPADRIRPRGEEDDEYVAEVSKREIERFPAYDESNLKDDQKWSKYEKDYRSASGFEETGGVMHQAGGTNILVPDSLPAEGRAPTGSSGQPVSGYKSPLQHRDVGMMDTTPTGVGQNPDNDRLTFVPDAINAGRGDIRDMDTQKEISSPPRQIGEAADIARESRARDLPTRETDMDASDRSGKVSVEQTIEGDAIFNNEDLRGRTHQSGNVRESDTPSYATVAGEGTQTTAGRTPNYPDAGQGQRWARFKQNLRRHRPDIVGECGVCRDFQNRHREDAA
jgi:sporulation protein YlmC with PRC-barrel domain